MPDDSLLAVGDAGANVSSLWMGRCGLISREGDRRQGQAKHECEIDGFHDDFFMFSRWSCAAVVSDAFLPLAYGMTAFCARKKSNVVTRRTADL